MENSCESGEHVYSNPWDYETGESHGVRIARVDTS